MLELARRVSAALRPPLWVSVSGLLALLTVIGVVSMPEESLESSATSYGTVHEGFGALHDLLHELQLGGERSRLRYPAVVPDRALWLLAPRFDPSRLLGGSDDAASIDGLQALRAYVYAGGTALWIGGDPQAFGELGLSLGEPFVGEQARVTGPLLTRPRELRLPELARFEPSVAAEPLLHVEGEPFAVLVRIGAGHLVAIADDAPFRNQHLDTADHALLAVDLVRALGPARLDERAHGLRPQTRVLAALGAHRVVLLLAALALLALAFIGHLRRVPAAVLAVDDGPDPSLSRFVDSLAQLYGRTAARDVARVHAAYVRGFRHRLRRALYGRGGGSDEQLSQRLARELASAPELADVLEGHTTARDLEELTRSVAEMERFFERSLWQPGQPGRGAPQRAHRGR